MKTLSCAVALSGLALSMALLHVPASQASMVKLRCERAKLHAQRKLHVCLVQSRLAVIVAKPDTSAACWDKFTTALRRADAAAVSDPCRYIDNRDGTVTDLNTGLVWEKKSPAGTGDVHDVLNTFTWSTGSPYSGTVFTSLLYSLNGGTSSDGVSTSGCFTGHCDWRLPTIEELQGILLHPYPCTIQNPCIDATFGPTADTYYWSATSYAGDPNVPWVVRFGDGIVNHGDNPSNSFARAVRGGF
jgi:hypothetical protein